MKRVRLEALKIVERVKGIEPSLSAWEADNERWKILMCQLEYSLYDLVHTAYQFVNFFCSWFIFISMTTLVSKVTE
ncbi:hypothetical protein EMIT0194MI4_30565 [Pseudomonas sp. IT-194MI4]